MPVVRSSEARRFEMEGFAVTSLAAARAGIVMITEDGERRVAPWVA